MPTSPPCQSAPRLWKELSSAWNVQVMNAGGRYHTLCSRNPADCGDRGPADGFCLLHSMDSVGVPPLLDAILTLMPLDTFESPAVLMDVTPEFKASGWTPPVWDTYKRIVHSHDAREEVPFEMLDRFEFYNRAKRAFAVVATGEESLFGNIILKSASLLFSCSHVRPTITRDVVFLLRRGRAAARVGPVRETERAVLAQCRITTPMYPIVFSTLL